MEAVESLLEQYVRKLSPERGFPERTMTALYRRSAELFASESGYNRKTRQDTLKELERFLNGVSFRIESALENATTAANLGIELPVRVDTLFFSHEKQSPP